MSRHKYYDGVLVEPERFDLYFLYSCGESLCWWNTDYTSGFYELV